MEFDVDVGHRWRDLDGSILVQVGIVMLHPLAPIGRSREEANPWK